jgi:arylsulfatase A-like enzyme
LAYNAPHTPLQADRRYDKVFSRLDEPNRLYAGMVAALDLGIGRVLETLAKLGLERDTLVALVSDNGPAMGAPYLKGWRDDWPKHTLLGSAGPLNGHKARHFEGGIRVPFILSWPGRLCKGRVSSMPVSTLDLYPTFCAAAGAVVPKGTILDGMNLLPYLMKENYTEPERTLYWKTHNGGAVRRGDWKLLVDAKGKMLLFNLAKDVGEQHDLAVVEPDVVRRLRGAWETWGSPFPRRAREVAEEKRKAKGR